MKFVLFPPSIAGEKDNYQLIWTTTEIRPCPNTNFHYKYQFVSVTFLAGSRGK
ncbi:MAG: hypothetical protein LBR79_01425 [Oscillospiraceae bacterium]|nr:hypothetical protein [Oscillospiraceae bacterium]